MDNVMFKQNPLHKPCCMGKCIVILELPLTARMRSCHFQTTSTQQRVTVELFVYCLIRLSILMINNSLRDGPGVKYCLFSDFVNRIVEDKIMNFVFFFLPLSTFLDLWGLYAYFLELNTHHLLPNPV